MTRCVCKHEESEHETVLYRGDKSRACLVGQCPCFRYLSADDTGEFCICSCVHTRREINQLRRDAEVQGQDYKALAAKLDEANVQIKKLLKHTSAVITVWDTYTPDEDMAYTTFVDIIDNLRKAVAGQT